MKIKLLKQINCILFHRNYWNKIKYVLTGWTEITCRKCGLKFEI